MKSSLLPPLILVLIAFVLLAYANSMTNNRLKNLQEAYDSVQASQNALWCKASIRKQTENLTKPLYIDEVLDAYTDCIDGVDDYEEASFSELRK